MSIAKMLDRPPSAVTREIIRNSDQYGYFYPRAAQEATQKRKNKMINRMPRKILSHKTPLDVFNKTFKSLKFKESRMKTAVPAVEANHYNQKSSSVAFRS